jgi:hypothetical protein
MQSRASHAILVTKIKQGKHQEINDGFCGLLGKGECGGVIAYRIVCVCVWYCDNFNLAVFMLLLCSPIFPR